MMRRFPCLECGSRAALREGRAVWLTTPYVDVRIRKDVDYRD